MVSVDMRATEASRIRRARDLESMLSRMVLEVGRDHSKGEPYRLTMKLHRMADDLLRGLLDGDLTPAKQYSLLTVMTEAIPEAIAVFKSCAPYSHWPVQLKRLEGGVEFLTASLNYDVPAK